VACADRSGLVDVLAAGTVTTLSSVAGYVAARPHARPVKSLAAPAICPWRVPRPAGLAYGLPIAGAGLIPLAVGVGLRVAQTIHPPRKLGSRPRSMKVTGPMTTETRPHERAIPR
jgi:hypothetical protein